MRSWHQNEGLLCLFIHFWLVSDDLNTNNSHSHAPPNLINESVTLRCYAADMLYITSDRSRRPAACTMWPRVAIFQVGFPELDSPFKQNATILSQAGKLLSVKRKKATLVEEMSLSHLWHHDRPTPLLAIWDAFKQQSRHQLSSLCLGLDRHSKNNWLGVVLFPFSLNKAVTADEIADITYNQKSSRLAQKPCSGHFA